MATHSGKENTITKGNSMKDIVSTFQFVSCW